MKSGSTDLKCNLLEARALAPGNGAQKEGHSRKQGLGHKKVLFLHFGHVRGGVQGLQNDLHPRAYGVSLEGEGAHGFPKHT
jgi:hypothetical protein